MTNLCEGIAYTFIYLTPQGFRHRLTGIPGTHDEIGRETDAEAVMIAVPNAPDVLACQSWEFEKKAPGGVVVGVDGSQESIAALNTAAAIARAKRCTLHVVSVLPAMPSLERSEALRIALRASELSQLLCALEAPSGWTSEAIVGRAAGKLTDIAERRCADLIVVGKRRHGALNQLIGNATTLQVMRLSSVPVLAVEDAIENPRTIVAAVDFSPSSVRAAKLALDLLKTTRSGSLYLVFVEPADLPANEFRLSAESRFPGDVVVWFRRLIDTLGPHGGIHIEPVILDGTAVSAVVEFAERVGADMVSAGSHSHGRLERFLLGSVSTGIVRDAGCPVLVVPPGS